MRNLVLFFILSVMSSGCSHSTGPGPALPFTAKSQLGRVDSLALTLNAGAQLMSVRCGAVRPTGQSETWQYTYYFPDTSAIGKLSWFHADAGGAAFDSLSPMWVGSGIMTHPWFDSDSAMAIAEQSGGYRFRNANPGCLISASVGQPVVPNATTYWHVTYSSASDKSKFILLSIDANTGGVKIYGPD